MTLEKKKSSLLFYEVYSSYTDDSVPLSTPAIPSLISCWPTLLLRTKEVVPATVRDVKPVGGLRVIDQENSKFKLSFEYKVS